MRGTTSLAGILGIILGSTANAITAETPVREVTAHEAPAREALVYEAAAREAPVREAPVHEAPTWIAIVAPAFREAIEPLGEHRRSEGYRVVILETSEVLSPEQIQKGDGSPLKERIAKLQEEAGGSCVVLLVGAVQAAADAKAPSKAPFKAPAKAPDETAAEAIDKTPAETPNDVPDHALRIVVPPLRGTVGRMKGRPTDNGYGSSTKDLLPRIAVGRFPARTADEARAMVQKTLDFERTRAPGAWADRITLLIGHPGGRSPMEKRLGEWFVQNAGARRFEKLAPQWSARAIFHAPESPYCVPDARLRDLSLRYLEEGQVFSLYLGHSSASGLWSDNAPFLAREDWSSLKIASGAGIFVTCGCYACQLSGPGGEGFGLAAARNPAGPAAVIGAHGESYGAIGQLALDGILQLLAAADPPDRLGEWWLALVGGIARAPMDPITFFLYDQADGSHGSVTLAVQRREHLEMWMLLGDPAMRLPLVPKDLTLECDGTVGPGKTLTIRGTHIGPSRAETPSGTRVTVTVERPFGSAFPDAPAIPEEPGKARDEALMARHERANSVVLERREVLLIDGRFECALTLPDPLPWTKLSLRARAEAEGQAMSGVISLEAAK